MKISLIVSLIFGLTSIQQPKSPIDPPKGCKILHKGTFYYRGLDEAVKVVIKGKKHIEYHNNGKYIIESKIKWVNSCEYNMTMEKVTIPDFPFKPGDVMNVNVDKIEGNIIYFTSTVKGMSWKNEFIKEK